MHNFYLFQQAVSDDGPMKRLTSAEELSTTPQAAL